MSDLHATILHLMGLDHTRLSYLHQGLNQRLTGVEERRVVMKALGVMMIAMIRINTDRCMIRKNKLLVS